MKTLTYKNQSATYQYSEEDECFYGKLAGIKDLVNFEAVDEEGIESAFEEAVDDYLEMIKIKFDDIPEKIRDILLESIWLMRWTGPEKSGMIAVLTEEEAFKMVEDVYNNLINSGYKIVK